ncbi:MAG TPA: PCRF domain-containing protein, partial [Acidocella sp.]|nr:PCRF domain-containing protein [Acidocella sp.]
MSLPDKLNRILARAEELRFILSGQLGGEEFVKASKELAELEPVEEKITALRDAEKHFSEAEALMADPEMKELAEQEYHELKGQIPELELAVRLALLPKDEADERAGILEIRPAAGGDEAGLFAAELFAAYQKYAATQGWRFEVLEYDESELGGLRGAMAEITGKSVFAKLKFESGVHRVQRVPATETQGRIHTSTITVAVLPEAEEVDVDVNETDLRIDV